MTPASAPPNGVPHCLSEKMSGAANPPGDTRGQDVAANWIHRTRPNAKQGSAKYHAEWIPQSDQHHADTGKAQHGLKRGAGTETGDQRARQQPRQHGDEIDH